MLGLTCFILCIKQEILLLPRLSAANWDNEHYKYHLLFHVKTKRTTWCQRCQNSQTLFIIIVLFTSLACWKGVFWDWGSENNESFGSFCPETQLRCVLGGTWWYRKGLVNHIQFEWSSPASISSMSLH